MVGPGQTFAEVAVIGGLPCPAYAEVTQAAQCALLPALAFLAMLREDYASCLDLLRMKHHCSPGVAWAAAPTDSIRHSV